MQKIILCSTWKRLAAFIIDFLIIDIVLLFPFQKIAEKISGFSGGSIITFQSSLIYLALAISIIFILYFAIFEYATGQTIGKMLMKIISISAKGKRMSFWQALGRNLFILPVIPFVFLWIVDPIFIIFRRISLSEMLTKTITIEEDKSWRTK